MRAATPNTLDYHHSNNSIYNDHEDYSYLKGYTNSQKINNNHNNQKIVPNANNINNLSILRQLSTLNPTADSEKYIESVQIVNNFVTKPKNSNSISRANGANTQQGKNVSSTVSTNKKNSHSGYNANDNSSSIINSQNNNNSSILLTANAMLRKGNEKQQKSSRSNIKSVNQDETTDTSTISNHKQNERMILYDELESENYDHKLNNSGKSHKTEKHNNSRSQYSKQSYINPGRQQLNKSQYHLQQSTNNQINISSHQDYSQYIASLKNPNENFQSSTKITQLSSQNARRTPEPGLIYPNNNNISLNQYKESHNTVDYDFNINDSNSFYNKSIKNSIMAIGMANNPNNILVKRSESPIGVGNKSNKSIKINNHNKSVQNELYDDNISNHQNEISKISQSFLTNRREESQASSSYIPDIIQSKKYNNTNGTYVSSSESSNPLNFANKHDNKNKNNEINKNNNKSNKGSPLNKRNKTPTPSLVNNSITTGINTHTNVLYHKTYQLQAQRKDGQQQLGPDLNQYLNGNIYEHDPNYDNNETNTLTSYDNYANKSFNKLGKIEETYGTKSSFTTDGLYESQQFHPYYAIENSDNIQSVNQVRHQGTRSKSPYYPIANPRKSNSRETLNESYPYLYHNSYAAGKETKQKGQNNQVQLSSHIENNTPHVISRSANTTPPIGKDESERQYQQLINHKKNPIVGNSKTHDDGMHQSSNFQNLVSAVAQNRFPNNKSKANLSGNIVESGSIDNPILLDYTGNFLHPNNGNFKNAAKTRNSPKSQSFYQGSDSYNGIPNISINENSNVLDGKKNKKFTLYTYKNFEQQVQSTFDNANNYILNASPVGISSNDQDFLISDRNLSSQQDDHDLVLQKETINLRHNNKSASPSFIPSNNISKLDTIMHEAKSYRYDNPNNINKSIQYEQLNQINASNPNIAAIEKSLHKPSDSRFLTGNSSNKESINSPLCDRERPITPSKTNFRYIDSSLDHQSSSAFIGTHNSNKNIDKSLLTKNYSPSQLSTPKSQSRSQNFIENREIYLNNDHIKDKETPVRVTYVKKNDNDIVNIYMSTTNPTFNSKSNPALISSVISHAYQNNNVNKINNSSLNNLNQARSTNYIDYQPIMEENFHQKKIDEKKNLFTFENNIIGLDTFSNPNLKKILSENSKESEKNNVDSNIQKDKISDLSNIKQVHQKIEYCPQRSIIHERTKPLSINDALQSKISNQAKNSNSILNVLNIDYSVYPGENSDGHEILTESQRQNHYGHQSQILGSSSKNRKISTSINYLDNHSQTSITKESPALMQPKNRIESDNNLLKSDTERNNQKYIKVNDTKADIQFSFKNISKKEAIDNKNQNTVNRVSHREYEFSISYLYDLKGHKNSVNSLAKDIEQDILWSCGQDYQIIKWQDKYNTNYSDQFKNFEEDNSKTQHINYKLNQSQIQIQTNSFKVFHKSRKHALCLLNDSEKNIVFAGFIDGIIRSWNIFDPENSKIYKGHQGPVYNLIKYKSDQFISTSGDSNLKIWDINEGEHMTIISKEQGSINSVCTTSDQNIIISGSSNKIIQGWDLRSNKSIFTFKEHQDTITSLVWINKYQKVISGSRDHAIKIWDLNMGKCLNTITTSHEIKTLAHNEKYNKLIIGGTNRIQIINLDSEKNVVEDFGDIIHDHINAIKTLCVDNTSNLLYTGSYDNIIKVWKLKKV